ncbi:hypothetical protein HI914_01535 [Erysiphe necator]|nr:hypothetical protein HI914_01535 [Erysiphe necator]
MRRSADKQARGGAIGQCGRQSKKTGGRRTKKESGHSSVRGAAEERFCEERMKEYRKWLAAENEALIPTNYRSRSAGRGRGRGRRRKKKKTNGDVLSPCCDKSTHIFQSRTLPEE